MTIITSSENCNCCHLCRSLPKYINKSNHKIIKKYKHFIDTTVFYNTVTASTDHCRSITSCLL